MSDTTEQKSEHNNVGLEGGEGGKHSVAIVVNGVEVQIHRGRRSVAEIKRLAGVPEQDVLAQRIDGSLKELADSDHVVLKGGEQFVSYPRACASS